MPKKKKLKEIETFKISRAEKSILCHLNDPILGTSPSYMKEDCSDIQCDCGSKDVPIGFLWESYDKNKRVFKFILQQILRNHNISDLSPWAEASEENSISDILFGETLEGEFYISLRRHRIK